jgi:DNA mismatch repair protein MutL
MPDYRSNDTSWEAMYGGIDNEKPLDLSPYDDIPCEVAPSVVKDVFGEQASIEEYVPMSQYKGLYILIPVKSGLMWVHQRRAHIRVLFEKYKLQIRERHSVSQGLLFPERVETTLNESVAIENIQEELSSLGFDISSLGGGTFAINGVPAGVEGLSPVDLLMEIVHGVMDETRDMKCGVDDRIALSMAKKVAIVPGQILSAEEMSLLVDELFGTTMPSHTPDGAVIIHILPDNDIDRPFQR